MKGNKKPKKKAKKKEQERINNEDQMLEEVNMAEPVNPKIQQPPPPDVKTVKIEEPLIHIDNKKVF